MTSIKAAALAAGLGAFALAGPASAASIVANGSFESGVPGNVAGLQNGATFSNMPSSGASWDIWQALDGWTTVSGPGIEVQTARTLPLQPADGNYYVELDSNANSTMSQTVNLGVGSYMLSFWYSPRVGNALTDKIEFGLGNAAGLLTSGFANYGTGGAVQGSWIEVIANFTVAVAGAYDLQFSAVRNSDSLGGLLDNIQIAPVPVPAAGFSLLAGLGAMGLARRRKAKARKA